MITKGIDLSLWDTGVNHDIPLDWSRYDWDFAFIKVSEGKIIDPAFEMQWSGAKGKAIRGAYHYFRCYVDPKQSVLATLEFLNNDYGELPLAFDLEGLDGFPASYVIQQSKSWLSWYEEFTGIRPIIYSRRLFLRDELKTANYDWLKNYKLWLAEYYFDRMSPVTSRNQRLADVLNGVFQIDYPMPPAPFSRVSFFQFSEFGQPEKIPGYYLGYGHKLQVDLNLYNGTQQQMFDEFKIGDAPDVPPPVDNGGTMPYTYGRVTASAGLNIRSGANSSFAKIGALQYGDEIEIIERASSWYHIQQARRNGVPVSLSNGQAISSNTSWVSDSYVASIPAPAWATVTPPDDDLPPPVVSPVIFASMDFDLQAKTMTTTRRRTDGTSDIDTDPIV